MMRCEEEMMSVEEARASIRMLLIDGDFETAKKEIFKFNNRIDLNVIDIGRGLYNMAYCLDALEDIEGSKYYLDKAISHMQKYKEHCKVEYCKALSLIIYQDRFNAKEDELLEYYNELYKYSKHCDDELHLTVSASIYKIKREFRKMIDVFKQCLSKGYIAACENIIQVNDENKEVVVEMQQILLNRKQEKTA